MKGSFLFVIFFTISCSLFAQDTIVYLDELTYQSDIEEKLIREYFNNNTKDYISLSLLTKPGINTEDIKSVSKRIENGLHTINTPSFQKKSEAKQVKTIFKTVHKLFLHKYIAEAEFYKIFENGEYNCVTASILYGIYLKKLNIPFIVNQTPIHVYLLAYPNTHRLLLETTDPVSGYLAFSPSEKKKFIDQLAQNKLISADEYQTQNTNVLFDKYYFTDDSIGLDELIGIQYYNKAILKFNEKQYKDAFTIGEKSYIFYPMEEMGNIMLASAAEILDNSTYNDKEDIELLAKISRYKKFGVEHNDLVNEYLRLINTQLINSGKVVYFEEVTTYLLDNIKDSLLQSDINFYYNYEMARYYYNKAFYAKSFPFAENAIALREQNVDVQSLFIHNLLQKIQKESNDELVLQEIESYAKKYKMLKENELFNAVRLQTYLWLMAQSFSSNDKTNGERFKNLFEINYKEKYNTIIDKNFIVGAYNAAAMYYFRKYNVARAEVILEKGLKYVPNNFDLENRLKQIKNY